jgi:hypothetical protein
MLIEKALFVFMSEKKKKKSQTSWQVRPSFLFVPELHPTMCNIQVAKVNECEEGGFLLLEAD